MGRRHIQADENQLPVSNYSPRKHRPPPCHPDRSAAQWRDLRCAPRTSQIAAADQTDGSGSPVTCGSGTLMRHNHSSRSRSKRFFFVGTAGVFSSAKLISCKPEIFSKCLRLFDIKGTEWRSAQAAIQRSLSATTIPAFCNLALSLPYSLQTSSSEGTTITAFSLSRKPLRVLLPHFFFRRQSKPRRR
jgi:hypothetical protein